ncbi:MAG: hypothetical protein V3S83_12585 [Gemmatimonadota bacterium]
MATINPLLDLTTLPTTRQTLFDMWEGSLSEISLDDFAEGFMPTITGSTFSDAPTTPQPGQMFWHLSENVMYLWHDEVDDTGVSLWLAIGPDKFETACLATEVIPAAWPVELEYDRKVRVERSNILGPPAAGALPVVLGFNQSGINTPVGVNDGAGLGGDTAVTDEWIRVGVDGLIYGAMVNALSSASSALADFTNSHWVFLRDIIGEEPSLVGVTGEPRIFNSIGMSTQWGTDGGSGAPTEPVHILKFQFSPRWSKQNDFRD